MAGDKIQIGPFIGGLNTQADPSAVADNDLVVCDNFEPDLDGSLKSRAPIVSNNSDMPLQSSGDLRLLGYFVNTDNTPYLIGTDGVSKTYALIGGTWTLITSTFAASAMAQFDGKAWLLAPVGSTNPGGYWTPVSSFVPQPNMPKGDVIVAHKLRLWVAPGGSAQTNGTRLYNSDVIGTSPLWPVSPDFTDIGGGDGQNIINAVVLFDSLLIFRTRSIFTFVFGTDPATAQVRVVQNNVGLTHKDALTMFENNIFFLYDSKAYIFQNSRAQQINQKVEFESGPTAGITQPFAVSIFNRRVIFSFWSNTYVFYIQNQTWTTWSSQAWGPIGRVLSVPPTSGPVIAYTHSSRTAAGGSSRSATTLRITDDITLDAENFICTLQTKNYNYQASDARKRLFYGGIDGIFRGKITADAVPIIYVKKLTWAQIRNNGLTWGFLRTSAKTWGALSSDRITVTAVIDADPSSAQRKFVKLWRSIFFRQIFYRLVFECDGSTATAPLRLFAIMTTVLAKKDVSQSVS
jgi:hypothetical protein